MASVRGTTSVQKKARSTKLKASTLVLIDASLPDAKTLVNGVVPDAIALSLTPYEDGVQQIGAAIAQYPKLTTVHLVCHGAPGCLYFGNTVLTIDTLDRHAWDLQSWFASTATLHPPSLLLYGCQVALGDRGQTFVQQISLLTGAIVAASSTPVGCTELGGNWELDVTTGALENALAFQPHIMQGYRHVLGNRAG